MFAARQVLFKGLHLILAVYQEFYVVTSGESYKAVTMFVCNITYLPHMLSSHKPGSTAS